MSRYLSWGEVAEVGVPLEDEDPVGERGAHEQPIAYHPEREARARERLLHVARAHRRRRVTVGVAQVQNVHHGHLAFLTYFHQKKLIKWSCFVSYTLSPAYKEFGYNEHSLITSRFLCIKITGCNGNKKAFQ